MEVGSNLTWDSWTMMWVRQFSRGIAEAALTRPRRDKAADNQAEARPSQGSQKTM